MLPDINKGFDISPGSDVKIDLNMEVIRRLDEPYEKCTEKKYLDNIDKLTDGDFKFIYSVDAAIARCQQLHTIKTCNCLHPYLPITPEVFQEHMVRHNTTSCFSYLGLNVSMMEMEESIRCFNTVSFEKACKDFLSPCKETVYTYKYHQVAWPHEIYEMAFYKDIINVTRDLRSQKFADLFSVYESIAPVLTQNRSEGLRKLREVDLIERNFIQLTARFQVNCFSCVNRQLNACYKVFKWKCV